MPWLGNKDPDPEPEGGPKRTQEKTPIIIETKYWQIGIRVKDALKGIPPEPEKSKKIK